MKKTKIDWCDCTINPVVGCKNGCPYCYAERINRRFGFVKSWREPEFFPERLKQLYSKTPKTIFMDSMSDVGWWKPEWGNKVFNAMKENKQHAYIFLTKNQTYPSGFHEIWLLKRLEYGEQFIFIGKSVTRQIDLELAARYDFFSIEPILESIDVKGLRYNLYCKAVIIGAETGNRKGKVIPKKEWIQDIVKKCDEEHVKVFMKESLRQLMGDEFRQDKLPWQEYVERKAKNKWTPINI